MLPTDLEIHSQLNYQCYSNENINDVIESDGLSIVSFSIPVNLFSLEGIQAFNLLFTELSVVIIPSHHRCLQVTRNTINVDIRLTSGFTNNGTPMH